MSWWVWRWSDKLVCWIAYHPASNLITTLVWRQNVILQASERRMKSFDVPFKLRSSRWHLMKLSDEIRIQVEAIRTCEGEVNNWGHRNELASELFSAQPDSLPGSHLIGVKDYPDSSCGLSKVLISHINMIRLKTLKIYTHQRRHLNYKTGWPRKLTRISEYRAQWSFCGPTWEGPTSANLDAAIWQAHFFCSSRSSSSSSSKPLPASILLWYSHRLVWWFLELIPNWATRALTD